MTQGTMIMPNGILNVYQHFTKSTNICTETDDEDLKVNHIVMGLLAEAGEIAGKYQKFYRKSGSGSTMSSAVCLKLRDDIIPEIGDLMWHVSELCNLYNISIEEVLEINMHKLKSRKERGVIEGDGDNR